jgi:hypothetical protein
MQVGSASQTSANYISQAVIGSLPKGLTADARNKIAASVPMSPSTAALKQFSRVSELIES